jgi:hypothetical protein
MKQELFEHAEECFQQSVEMQIATTGDGTTSLATTLMDLARARAKLGRWAGAVRAAYDCAVIRKRRLGRHHGATRSTLGLLEELRDYVGGVLPGEAEGEPADDWVAGPPIPGSKAEELATTLVLSLTTAREAKPPTASDD